MAFGAVAGSIAVLITCVQNQQLVNIGVVHWHCSACLEGRTLTCSNDVVGILQGGVLQCGFILLGALLLWTFRTSDAEAYTY